MTTEGQSISKVSGKYLQYCLVCQKKLTIATSMSEIRVYSNLSAVIFSLGYRVDPLIQKHR